MIAVALARARRPCGERNSASSSITDRIRRRRDGVTIDSSRQLRPVSAAAVTTDHFDVIVIGSGAAEER